MTSRFTACSVLVVFFSATVLSAQMSGPRLGDTLKSTTAAPITTASDTSIEASPLGTAIVRTDVRVQADPTPIPENAGTAYKAKSSDILSSAGTYGDFSRYLQVFPGVAFNSDESDDLLVRGGNPIENLFLVDGIEVPNINHMATAATTGGLVSMIDTATIQGVDFRTGGYDASYEERLSSVVDIHTRDLNNSQPYNEVDAGFVGAGGFSERTFGPHGALLVGGHRSLLNLFTQDIGLNGVPVYTNGLARVHWCETPANDFSTLSLIGFDSINIRPNPNDNAETGTIQTQFSGWRMTNGFRLRHIYSPSSFGLVTASDSEQSQNIQQQDQLINSQVPPGASFHSDILTPVYSELTHDGATSLKYDHYLSVGKHWYIVAGGVGRLMRVNYSVTQPLGQLSPFSAVPGRSDAASFYPHFATNENGMYGQATLKLANRWIIGGGGRLETFSFGGHMTGTPRANVNYQLSKHTDLHASFGEYTQMAPFLYLTAFPQNHFLSPIRARHVIAGVELYADDHTRVGLEGYEKNYRNYPVATEYPSLSLANMVDTFGQQFVWLPMNSAGRGITRGIELSVEKRFVHFFTQANLAYARSRFSGTDGVLRPGNFDLPWIFNAAGVYRPGRRYEVSYRYEFTSGRPYTPFQLVESTQQHRPIYDLTQINARRAPVYSRLDFSINRIFHFGATQLIVYGGLENALDRKNFLTYAWMPRIGSAFNCATRADHCQQEQYQMGIFPNFGLRVVF